MKKKFKDLKKGDHLYFVAHNIKTHESKFYEWKLVTDMEFVKKHKMLFNDEILPIYRCFMIPINYDENDHLYTYDGINPIEWQPGWAWDYDGEDFSYCTDIEDARKYYLKYCCDNSINKINKEINKLQKKIDRLTNIKNYHMKQKKNFDFNRKI